MLWNEGKFEECFVEEIILLNRTSKKKSTLDLIWCTPYIPMKQTLFIANVLSSNCGMYFFLDQIWVCVYFSWWYPSCPPSKHKKSVQATGKLIQKITKALVVNTIRPYIWLNSKSAAFDPVTSELLPTAQPKKNSRYVKTVLHPFKLICYHKTNV